MRSKVDFSDQVLFYESLKSGQTAAYEHLYRLLFRRITNYIFLSGGTRDDTKDVVQETIIAFTYNLRYQKYEWRQEAQLMTYVVQIARNKWSLMRRRNSRMVSTDTYEWPLEIGGLSQADQSEPDFEQQRLAVEKQMLSLSDRCRQLIELYYFEKKKMPEIAASFNWANEHVARTKKYECLQRLRKLLGLADGNI